MALQRCADDLGWRGIYCEMLQLVLEVVPPEIRDDDTTPLTPEWYARTDDLIVSSRRALAFVEGDPVGAVWYAPFGASTIAAVFVLPEFRGAGTATALYRHAATQMGVSFSEMASVAGIYPGGRALAKKLGITIDPRTKKVG